MNESSVGYLVDANDKRITPQVCRRGKGVCGGGGRFSRLLLTSRLRHVWNEQFIAFFPALIVALIDSFCHVHLAEKIDTSLLSVPQRSEEKCHNCVCKQGVVR